MVSPSKTNPLPINFWRVGLDLRIIKEKRKVVRTVPP